jgi:hypothetical protein
MTSAASVPDGFERGAANLLESCAGARPGERLLILEEHGTDYYDPILGPALAETARARGLLVERVEVPFQPDATALPPDLANRLGSADHVLFLARLGDQLRFKAMPPDTKPIVSYVLDANWLAAPLGTAPYEAFAALKQALDLLFAEAGRIHVTCPLGTDYAGSIGRDESGRRAAQDDAQPDVAIKRFPMSVFSPISAATFSGRIAVAHCLAGTGARYYTPYGVALDRPVFAILDGQHVRGWEGDAATISLIEAHYARVADMFGLEPAFVHSWHAGIHPGCAYQGRAIDHLERWSGSAFGNPRLLHFHTCGAEPPGEICWNIVDPTVTVDGVAIWDGGRLHPERFEGGRRVLADAPELVALFADPARDMGL